MTNEIILERVYNIPLRREFIKTNSYKKTKKAVKAVREFISKHMKCDNIKIGQQLIKISQLKAYKRLGILTGVT